jgi:hypothetical protein
VYDDLNPVPGQRRVGEVRLFGWIVSPPAMRRLANRRHDLPQPRREDWVPDLDVLPTLFRQDDAAAVGIESRGDHGAIVAASVRPHNSLLEACP